MALEVSVPSWRVRGLPPPCAQASRQACRCGAHPVRARAAPRAPQRRTVSAGPVIARCPPFVPRRNWQPQCQVVAAAPGQCPTRKPQSAGRSRVKNRTSPATREPRRPRRDSSSSAHRRPPAVPGPRGRGQLRTPARAATEIARTQRSAATRGRTGRPHSPAPQGVNADLTPRDSAAPASTGALRPFPIARAAFPVLSLRETVWPSGDFFLQRALRSSSLKIVVKVSLGSLGGREARRRVGAAQARVGTRVRLSCDHSFHFGRTNNRASQRLSCGTVANDLTAERILFLGKSVAGFYKPRHQPLST